MLNLYENRQKQHSMNEINHLTLGLGTFYHLSLTNSSVHDIVLCFPKCMQSYV